MPGRKDVLALVTDDNEVNLMVCNELLSVYNLTVHLADCGEKALELAEQLPFDIVFLDHIMPGLDGLETCRRLRAAGGRYAALPIIMMTGNDVAEYEREYREAGFDGWLTKPVGSEGIERVLKTWLGDSVTDTVSGGAPRSGPDNSMPDAPAWYTLLSGRAQLDAVFGLSLMRGNYDSYRKLLSAFCYQVEQKETPMSEMLRKRRLDSYAVEAHSFKGSLNNIGAAWLAETAKNLEQSAKLNDIAPIITGHGSFYQDLKNLAQDISESLNTGQETNIKLPRGSTDILAIELQKALDAMREFETSDAADIIKVLRGRRFSREYNKKLTELESLIDMYEFDRFTRLLTTTIEQIHRS